MSTREYAKAKIVPVEVDGKTQTMQLSKSKEKGTDQVIGNFEIVSDGPHKGKLLAWTGFFTEKSVERTLESLRYLGLQGNDVRGVLTQPMDNVVPVTIESEEYEGKTRYKIGFINDPDKGNGFVTENQMSTDNLASFAALLQNRLAGKAARKKPNGASSAPLDPEID